MDRVIFVGILYLGVGYATSYSSYTSQWDYGRDYPTRPPMPVSYNKELKWINRNTNNCSIEVTCMVRSCIEYMKIRFTSFPSSWKCLPEEKHDKNKEDTDNTVKYVYLKLIGSYITELKINSDNKFTKSIKKILLIGNSVDVPQYLFNLTALEDIEINGYEIKALNLTRFLELEKLKKLNVSRNLIKDIINNKNDDEKIFKSKLEIFDLSHNLIKNVRNSWKLSYFANLTFLDLSYNEIKNIDVDAFKDLTQLKNLYLSHNHIMRMGSFLSELINIKEVTFDYNDITAIEKVNFAGLNKIEKLNLSSNALQVIQDQSFDSLTNLVELDLSYNKLNIIEKQLLKNNNKLSSLLLSNNNIETFDSGALEGKNITKFEVGNNAISGAIDKGFQTINVQHLDLSKMQINLIGPKSFNSAVRNLNMSHNSIKFIDTSAFLEAEHLKSLDLSYNHLINIYFNFSTKELSFLNLQHNYIQEIKQTALRNLNALEKLDLSDNTLNRIEKKSFTDMKSLEVLRLNSIALKHLEIGTFDGLVSLMYLDVSNSSISELQDDQFLGLKQLEILNVSYCQLQKIQYNSFKNLDSIKYMDFSYNLLMEFSINNKDIASVTVLFLSFNKIKSISYDTFRGLSRLFSLELSNNNILEISHNAFNSLKQLRTLNLAFNTNTEINTNAFNNLALDKLILKNITKHFNFEHSINIKVLFLDLSLCQIKKIEDTFVYKLDIKELVLKSNKITQLDKHSFQNLSSLESLDVSSNAISYIRPGTFLKLVNLKTLDLHDNNINKLEHGAFEGLKNLVTLNLSSNDINSFEKQNVRNLPALKYISLDNNNIKSFSLYSFDRTKITKVTIGGNPISCSHLSYLIEEPYDRARSIVITAEILDFHSENINGISCSQEPEYSPEPFRPPLINATYLLANAIEKLQETISLQNSADGKSSITVKNNNAIQNEHSDIKSLVFITVACLVIIVVMYLTIFVPKVKRIFLYNLKGHQTGNPLLNNGVEME